MVSFWNILALAALGVLAMVGAAAVPHADETARALALHLSDAGQMMIGAAMGLAVPSLRSTNALPAPGPHLTSIPPEAPKS